MYGTISFNDGLTSPSADLRVFDAAQGRRLRQAACDRCRTSRVKCHRQEGSSACDRCSRLEKSCRYQHSHGNRQTNPQHPQAPGSNLLDNGTGSPRPVFDSPSVAMPNSGQSEHTHERESPASSAPSTSSALPPSDTPSLMIDDTSSIDLSFQWPSTLEQFDVGHTSWDSLDMDTMVGAQIAPSQNLDMFAHDNLSANDNPLELTKIPPTNSGASGDLHRHRTVQQATETTRMPFDPPAAASPSLSEDLLTMARSRAGSIPDKEASLLYPCSCLRKLTSNLHMLQSSTKAAVPRSTSGTTGVISVDQYLVLHQDSMAKLCAVEACQYTCLQSWDLALLVFMSIDHLAKIQLDLASRVAAPEHTTSSRTSPGRTPDDSLLVIKVGAFKLDDLNERQKVVRQLLLHRIQGLQAYCGRSNARLVRFGLGDLSSSFDEVGKTLKNAYSLVTL